MRITHASRNSSSAGCQSSTVHSFSKSTRVAGGMRPPRASFIAITPAVSSSNVMRWSSISANVDSNA